MRAGLLELLDEHLGVAAALVVFLAASGRQIVRRTFSKAALGLEIGEGLRGKGDEFVEAHLTRLVLDELNQLAADALVFVGRADVQAGEFPLALLGISVQGDAGDRVPVNLEKEVVAQLLLDGRAGALDQFLAFDGALGEVDNAADILFECAANLLEFVAVHQGADTFVGEDLREQPFLDGAVDDMDAGHAGRRLTGPRRPPAASLGRSPTFCLVARPAGACLAGPGSWSIHLNRWDTNLWSQPRSAAPGSVPANSLPTLSRRTALWNTRQRQQPARRRESIASAYHQQPLGRH